jgi:hypothetical protein
MQNRPSPPPPASLVSQEGWAEVRARNQTVRYRRTGAGRPALLLYALSDSEALWPEMLEALASGYRLIVPSPPEAGNDVESWLAALMDGLGLSSCIVIATDRFEVAALERALESGQVGRIVLVLGSDAVTGATRPSALPDRTPLLVLRRDQPAAEIVPQLLDFLQGDAGARDA